MPTEFEIKTLESLARIEQKVDNFKERADKMEVKVDGHEKFIQRSTGIFASVSLAMSIIGTKIVNYFTHQ